MMINQLVLFPVLDTVNVVAFGGGTDSTAMLIGMYEKGIRVDLILFADTGGERPEVYFHIQAFSQWLIAHGMPPIITVKKVRRNGEVMTLEEDCLEKNMLPSIAYGFKSCSQKYKVQPQDKFVNNWEPAKQCWDMGWKVTKFIGYDSDEERRASIREDEKYDYRYPLIEWGWDRDKCVEVILGAGISLPGKSACFFCPSSKKKEILELKKSYPDLIERAVVMESGAQLTSIKGLGRRFSWKSFLDEHEAGISNMQESHVNRGCGCFE